MPPFTPEQERAIGRRDGSLFVRAGAGTGKTSVLVERFVQSVVSDEHDVESILAITFTEKAASELKVRVRRRFLELGEREAARQTDGAWISTIHGFCSRVLRTHALAAGIDPEYRVLEELEAERVALAAFDRALEEFLGDGSDPARLEVAAAYTPDGLRDMVRTAYSHLRSKGEREPSLPSVDPPAPGREAELLRAAADHALRELGAAGDGAQVRGAIEKLERCVEALGRVPEGELGDPGDFEKLELTGRAKALESAACEEYAQTLAAWRALCLSRNEYRDHSLVRELLELYGRRYEALKRERSGLDFEDLELIARDLLRDQPGIRGQYAERFGQVMVDEFQDTNPLQNQILSLIERDNLFRVGDEHQSIYGFRHADVEVFREHHAAAQDAGRVEPISVNFRSRGEVVDAIDMTFGRAWKKAFEPLRAGPDAREGQPRLTPPVELLVVEKDKKSWDRHFDSEEQPFGQAMRAATIWRGCEARLLAKRIDELTGEGPFEYRDVALLLRATTHMTFYERALEERGVPTHVVGGRGYWSQQQVGDLRHWLAALANPRDELALFSVLASPLVGASLDAVAMVALERRRSGRDAWWTLEAIAGANGDGPGADLPDGDRERIASFVRRFGEERARAPQVSLETVIDRAVTVTGYDRHVLSLPAGDRRMANVRKLMRVAREFESEEGRDLRRFIDFVAERDLIQEREGEAPLEAEELDAIRIMTVHRAKGLEFPVVCVGDLGKDGRDDNGALRMSDDGRTGMRLARIGGGSIDTAELERIKEEQKHAAEAEEKRIFYVALTRAREHLVLSGATDLQKRPEEKPLCEPMRWLWRALCPSLPNEGASGEAVDRYEDREVRVRWTRCDPGTVDELLPARDRIPARPANGDEKPAATPPLELASVPAPRALPVSRLSYSGLESYKRCGYRFYLERALRLPGGDALRLDGDGAGVDARVEDEDADELPALLRGQIVHELLERVDFRRPLAPSEKVVREAIERHGAEAAAIDVADVRGLVEGFLGSELFARIARAGRVKTELPFAFSLSPDGAGGRSLLVNGVVDVHAEEAGRTLIVDYKSDRLEGADPVSVCEEKYATQRLVYALAGLHAGAPRAEVVYVFLERAGEPVTHTFEAEQADALERDLLELARGVVEARFEPTAEPHRELCADCPGQPALCSWPPERTLAAR